MRIFTRFFCIGILMLSYSLFTLAQTPFCSPPANITVVCDAFDPTFPLYGDAGVDPSICLASITNVGNYSQFDTVCHQGNVLRVFTATSCAGLTSQCTQTITVTHRQDYYLHLPPDYFVSNCNANGNYGSPVMFDNDCEHISISSEDELITIVPDVCFKINRKWKMYNACTYNLLQPCVQIPNPNPNAVLNHPANLNAPTLKVTPYTAANLTVPADMRSTLISISPGAPQTDYSIFYQANANCYEYQQIIKVNDNGAPKIDSCLSGTVQLGDSTNNDGALWNDSMLIDPVHNTRDLCERPVEMRIFASDLCAGTDVTVRYLLFLDTNNSGDMETVVSSNNLPAAGFINVGNVADPNFTGGTPVSFDKRQVAANQKFRFSLSLDYDFILNRRIARVGFNTSAQPDVHKQPQLPHGRHKIKWFVTDKCGMETTCEYTFVIRDSKPPTVVCLNGISVNIMPTGLIQIWDTELLQYTVDNCTPDSLMSLSDKTAICTNCTSFPLTANGTPNKNVTFTCAHLGTQSVRIWSRDAAGNADYCETYVLVQDNATNCVPNHLPYISGTIRGTNKMGVAVPVANVGVALYVTGNPSIPPFSNTIFTNTVGFYNASNAIPLSVGVTITPIRDVAANGINMLDALKIQRHILGLEALSNPYRQIAADVNNTRSITSSDIVELRKRVLGLYTSWPNLYEYRFVPSSYVFPNPNNPFVPIFPETITLPAGTGTNGDGDFTAIIVGDVTGDGFQLAGDADDRTVETIHLDVADAQVTAGEVHEVRFHADQPTQATQFTLDLQGLELVSTDLPQETHHVHHDGTVTVAADGLDGYTLNVKALQSGHLSQMLAISSRITEAVAFTPTGQRADVALRFKDADSPTEPTCVLFQNKPNPFSQATVIGFNLPKATKATLTVHDQLGRMVHTQSGHYEAGAQSIRLSRAQLANVSGLYYFTLATDGFTATKQMILVD